LGAQRYVLSAVKTEKSLLFLQSQQFIGKILRKFNEFVPFPEELLSWKDGDFAIHVNIKAY
jgi:hypothetical protein